MQKIFSLLSILMVALMLAGCESQTENLNNSSKEDEVTFRLSAIGANSDSNKTLEYAIQKVQEKYPNVKFEKEDFPQDGGQTLKARAATGDLPEIIWLNTGLIEPLSKSGSLVQLDQYAEDADYIKTLNEAARENSLISSDGHVYAFPVDGVAPIVWFYNKDLFVENDVKIPENYEELLLAVKTFKQEDIIPMALFGKEPWPLGAFFDAFAIKGNSAGAKALSEGKAMASDKEYSKAIEKMQEVIEAGIFQKGVTNADYDTAFAMFSSGQAAMFQNGVWNIPDLTAALGDSVGYFPSYPTNDAGTDNNANAFTGGGDTVGYGVSESTENKELAIKVAKILSQSSAEYNYAYLGNISSAANPEIYELVNELPPMSQDLVKQIPEMKFDSAMLQNFKNVKFFTGFTEEMQRFLVGESSEDFIKNVDSLIENTTK